MGGDNKGNPGFHHACAEGHLNVVQSLLQQGFDINIGDNDGNTGFHQACYNGCLNVIQFLLQQGFDWSVRDNNGRTGFHDACFSDNLNVVQFLVQRGFDWNVVNNLRRTGFHLACISGNVNVIRFLLQHGFKGINELDLFGEIGLKILIEQARYDFDHYERIIPCVLLLIEAGSTLLVENAVFEELHSAIQNRIIEITFMKEIIFEKWTGRIAQVITDFTMEAFTDKSLQNLSQFLNQSFKMNI